MHKSTAADGKWLVDGRMDSVAADARFVVTLINQKAYLQVCMTGCTEVRWCTVPHVVLSLGAQEFNASVSDTVPVRTSCYTPFLPPLGDLSALFTNAAWVAGSDTSGRVTTPACTGRDRFMLQWGGDNILHTNTFVLCSVDASTYSVRVVCCC